MLPSDCCCQMQPISPVPQSMTHFTESPAAALCPHSAGSEGRRPRRLPPTAACSWAGGQRSRAGGRVPAPWSLNWWWAERRTRSVPESCLHTASLQHRKASSPALIGSGPGSRDPAGAWHTDGTERWRCLPLDSLTSVSLSSVLTLLDERTSHRLETKQQRLRTQEFFPKYSRPLNLFRCRIATSKYSMW